MTTVLQEKFTAIRDEINEELVEREVETDLVVRMLLARVHGVFLGSWGVGKSMLIRKMLERVDQAQLFETLLVRNAPAEQVVGPVSLKALEEDRFERITTGKLPEANVAFLDEIFKSNATVLNNLLSIINERIFHNNGTPVPVPLWALYGASNELPVEQREELGAFYDRLAVRVVVEPVKTPDGIRQVLRDQVERSRGNRIAKNLTKVTIQDVETAQDEVLQVNISDATLDGMIQLRGNLRSEGMDVSIRRLGEGVKLMQAAAWLRGAKETNPEDLLVMQHIVWDEPDEERKKAYEMTLEFASPVSRKAEKLRDQIREIEVELRKNLEIANSEAEASVKSDAFSESVNLSYQARSATENVAKEIKRAEDQGLDTSELLKVQSEVDALRQLINDEIIGG